MTSKQQSLAKSKLLKILFFIVITTFALSFFPITEYNYIPQCPWNKLTDTYCPGCGSVRGMQLLVNGNILGLAQNNLLLVVMLPFLTISFFNTILQALKGYKLFSVHITKNGIIMFAIIMITYWVLRNFIPILAPIPL